MFPIVKQILQPTEPHRFVMNTGGGSPPRLGNFIPLNDVNSIPAGAVEIKEGVFIGAVEQSPSILLIGGITQGHGLDYVDVSTSSTIIGVQNNCQIYCNNAAMPVKPVWAQCSEGSLPSSGDKFPVSLGKYEGKALYLGKKTGTWEIGTVIKQNKSYQCFIAGEAQPVTDFEVLCRPKCN